MTRKMILIAGAATMALSVPAMAGPKDGRGGSHGAQAQERGGQQKAERGGQQKAERGGQKMQRGGMERAGRGSARTERPQRQQQVRMERPLRQERQVRVGRPSIERSVHMERPRIERPKADRDIRLERQERQVARDRVTRMDRPVRIERAERPRAMARVDRPKRIEAVRPSRADDARRDRDGLRAAAISRDYDGYKNFGQAVAARAHLRNEMRKEAKAEWRIGQRINSHWAGRDDWTPMRYADRYYDTPDWTYRYDGDNMYRVSRDTGLIGAIIPLLGGAYSVGQPMPGYYSSSYVPLGYRSMYYDTPDHYYRYGDGGLYQVNAGTGLITSLVALLTGTNLGIGQMLPTTYNAYNVPYAYRSQYYDTPDNWYRYNNGYIYQVDPYSRMVEASYPIYGNGYYDVGQTWPAAYPSYNVPEYYQSTYYDTPQWDYRYANGAIYQVNPETQLINALVSLVTGSPMNVGQTMPSGYGVYNVPLQYRSQYYDTADNWYRYGDGNIYRVDPYSGRIAEVIPAYA